MLKKCIGFFLVLLTFSCTKEYQPRVLSTLEINPIVIDATSIRAIHVVNDSTVYYAGSNGTIGYSDNNGASWAIKKIKYKDSIVPHFRSMASNGKEIFALSIGNPALLYNCSTGSLVYKEAHEKVFYDAMTFVDDSNGIAMGDPTDDCISIITTSNGGKNWLKVPCENIPAAYPGEAAFAASNTNISVVGENIWIATGGAKARIFYSADLGEHWKVYDTPIIQGDGPQGIYSIDFADEKNGIVVGGNYAKPEENIANKAITKDGGKTWEIVSDGKNPNYKSCVQYVPNTQGKEVFAVGKTGISYSTDGGVSWNELSKDGYYGIQFLNRNTAWLFGHQKMAKLSLPE